MVKTKCILDCDPGHDDAIAIALVGKSKELDCLGITTVRGNQTIEKTTKNTLNILEYLGLDIKVYEGSSKPLVKNSPVCSEIHGESGLEGFSFLDLKRKKEELDALSFIGDCVKKNPGIVLIPTGPLTNIAKVISNNKDCLKNISKIVLMGGSIGDGNITKYAEFNILTDPEAAKIVFESGIPVYMVGLDVTRKCLVDEDVISYVSETKTTGTKLFEILMVPFLKNQRDFFGLAGAPLHDPLTVAYLMDSSILEFKKCNISVDAGASVTNGRTYVEFSESGKHFAAVSVDVAKYFKLIKDVLIQYK